MGKRKPRDEKRAEVEKELYNYKALLIGIDNGPINDLETEKEKQDFARMKERKKMKSLAIESGLTSLTHKERELIECKYFDPNNNIDYYVLKKIGVGVNSYYKLKEQALNKMANALNII